MAGSDQVLQELLHAAVRLLADQHGNMVLIDVKRLRKYGYRFDAHVVTHRLLRELLTRGVKDPLGRGVWVYFSERAKRDGKGGRKKYLAVLRSPE